MAPNEPVQIVEPLTAPLHYTPGTMRELRAQSVHRLQVGLFGLCAMLLIVGLANIIMDRAKLNEAKDPIEQVIAADEPPKKPAVDPLADIGVVPAADPVVDPAAEAQGNATAAAPDHDPLLPED